MIRNAYFTLIGGNVNRIENSFKITKTGLTNSKYYKFILFGQASA